MEQTIRQFCLKIVRGYILTDQINVVVKNIVPPINNDISVLWESKVGKRYRAEIEGVVILELLRVIKAIG